MDMKPRERSQEDQIKFYRAKAEEARAAAARTRDEDTRQSLMRVVGDWEQLAAGATWRRQA